MTPKYETPTDIILVAIIALGLTTLAVVSELKQSAYKQPCIEACQREGMEYSRCGIGECICSHTSLHAIPLPMTRSDRRGR